MGIQVAPDSGGKIVETASPTVGEHRQIIAVGDAQSTDIADVISTTPPSNSVGLVVREVSSQELLQSIHDMSEVLAFLATSIHDRLGLTDTQERQRVFLDASNGAYTNLAISGAGNTSNGQIHTLVGVPYALTNAHHLYNHIEVS